MKCIKYIVFLFLVYFIGLFNVNALVDYGIVVDNEIKVYDLTDDSEVVDYSGILSYENNVLTLKKDMYIEYIEVSDTITITSNNEQVYINKIENKSNNNKVTFNKFNMDIYVKDGLSTMGIYFKGDIDILNSDIDLTAILDKYNRIETNDNLLIDNSKVSAVSSVTASDNMTINNSIVNSIGVNKSSEGHVEVHNETMTITDSTVTANYRITSKLDMTITNSTVTSTTYAVESYYASVTIIDSKVYADYEIYCGKNLVLKNSEVDIMSENVSYSGYIQIGGDLVLENSRLYLKKYISASGSISIKDSTLKTFSDDGYVYCTNGAFEAINSKLDLYYYIYVYKEMTVNDSIINVGPRESFGSGYISSRGEMSIVNSEINSYGSIYNYQNMYIKNSKINTIYKNNENIYLSSQMDMFVEDSIVNFGNAQYAYISSQNNVYIKNSEVYALEDNTGYGYIYGKISVNLEDSIYKSVGSLGYLYGGDINIVDSSVETNSYMESNNINIKDSDVTIGSYIYTKKINVDNSDFIVLPKNTYINLNITGLEDSKFINSYIKLAGGIKTNSNLLIKDSYLYTENRNKEETSSTLVVLGNLDIDNSRVIVSSTSIMPAVLVKGNITLNEGNLFKDDNKKMLDVVKVVVSKENYLYNPENASVIDNEKYVTEGEEVKSVSLNNTLTKYAETEGYYYVTLKVVNGKWQDGTDEDVLIKTLFGEEYDESNLPVDMIANDGYQDGEWKNTNVNEYTYTFEKVPERDEVEDIPEDDDIDEEEIENPNTGLYIGLVFSIISIIIFSYLFKLSRRNSMFRRI